MTHTISNPVILGTGPLGLAVMDVLSARNLGGGMPNTLVNRSGKVGEALPAHVTAKAADLYDPAAVRAVCAGHDVVFFCAQPEYTEWPEKFPPLVRSLVEGLTGTGVRLVFGDNLYMYGPTDGAPITETLPYAATGRKGKTRAQLATMLMDAHKQGKLQVAIGRASDFYGPRVRGSVLGDIVFEPAMQGKAVNLLGDIDLPHTYTYIGDFAKALVTLAEHDEAFGETWHVPNAETVTTREMLTKIGTELGAPIKPRTAGKTMLSLLALFSPVMREFKEMYYEFDEPYVVDDSKFRRAFGNGVTPHEEGVRATVDWYRKQAAKG